MLEQASLNGVIRTIFIILCIWYGFKLLMRIFAPYLMKKIIQKAGANFRWSYEQQFGTTQNKSQKSTTNTDSSNSKTIRATKKMGEYIDYEEIE